MPAWPADWDGWSKLFQVVGLGIAVAFFATKSLLGYFMINLSIKPALRRYRSTNVTDDIVLDVELIKGDREAASIFDITLTPTCLPACDSSFSPAPQRYDMERRHGRRLKLSPGEASLISFHINVPANAVCNLQIEVRGGSGFLGWPPCYWLATATSLPQSRLPFAPEPG